MRVVIDANVFVSASISPKGTCGQVLLLVLENREIFELILTEKIISETIASLSKPRVIRYSKRSIEDSKTWMENISTISTFIADMPISFRECRDPDDVVYLAAADAAKARFIISGDRDLLVLKSYREVDILSPTEFLSVAEQMIEA